MGKRVVVNASFLKRGLAVLIDLVIINLVILFPFGRIIRAVVPLDTPRDVIRLFSESTIPDNVLASVTILSMLMTFLYFYLIERRLNQTPGKMMLSIAIEPVTKKAEIHHFLRAALFVLVLNSMYLIIIDVGFSLFNQNNQRLGEYLTGSRVVGEVIP